MYKGKYTACILGETVWRRLVSLFYWHINLCGLLDAKAIHVENQQ